MSVRVVLFSAAVLAACASTEEGAAPPAPTTTTPEALASKLRYCLSPDLGRSAPIVEQLLLEAASLSDADPIDLLHVADLDATCDYDVDGIDFVVAAWSEHTSCRHAPDQEACATRTLLVELAGLGTSTEDAGDPEVVDEVRGQLELMRAEGVGTADAPPLGPPGGTVTPTATGCGFAQIGLIMPAAPNAFQLVTFASVYQADTINCTVTTSWSSDLDGGFGSGTSAVVQLSEGQHIITFTVTAVCTDPLNPDADPITYTCSDQVGLTVSEGELPVGSYCDRDQDWWKNQYTAGAANVIDTRGTPWIVTIPGTDKPDLLVGNDQSNRINGRRAGDCLYGHVGHDLIAGHHGGDTVFGGEGYDRIHGHDDQDRVWGESGHDHIRGGNGGDYLVGGDGDDDLRGSFDRDTLFGDRGRDHLDGGWDDDGLYGGDDDDDLDGSDGDDWLWGGPGADRLKGGLEADHLLGGDGNDCMRGDAGGDVMDGEDGDDNMDGEVGADVMNGGDGDDYVYGGIDGDVLRGGAGNDGLMGNAGGDQLYGEGDDDTLCGGFDLAVDSKDGGPGTDECQSGGNTSNCDTWPSPPWSCPLPTLPSC